MLSARVQAGLGRLQRAGWAACACALAGPTARGISDSAGGEGGAADSGVEGSRASGDDGGKFPEQIVIKPTPVVGLHRLGALDEAGAASEESLPFLDDFGGLNKPLGGAPKEDLVQLCLDVENLSMGDRMKRELAAIQQEFGRHADDVGSSEVQIAQLTRKIEHMTQHLGAHRHDIHGRRTLQRYLNQRKSLMKYLRRTSFARYKKLCIALGLKDYFAPDIVARRGRGADFDN